MEPIVITSAFYLAIALLCWARPNAGRICVGLFFWVMAVGVHGYFVLANPQGYVDFAEDAHFRIYRDLSTPIIEFSPEAFGVFMALFELTIGALILSKGRLVKGGLVAAIVFLVSISPLMAMTLPNLILAATLAYVVTREFDTALWEMIAERVRRHRRTAQGTVTEKGVSG